MKKKHFLAALIIVLPIIYTAFTWSGVPLVVPLHHDLRGVIDRTGPKEQLLLVIVILSAVNILVYLLLCNVHRIKTNLKASSNRVQMQMMGLGICFFMSAVQLWILYHARMGLPLSSMKFILVMTGLLFSFIGNYMHTIRPNYFAGFRMPWTLKNGDNWRQTHHFASWLWFGGGCFVHWPAFFFRSLPPWYAMRQSFF